MKRLIPLVLILALGGCASLQNVWSVVTGVSVSPTQIVVAGNAFDAAETSATQYLLWCKQNAANAACALSTRKSVVAAVRSGRAARNALEPYVVSGTAGPSALYNTLVAAINTLQASQPAIGASK